MFGSERQLVHVLVAAIVLISAALEPQQTWMLLQTAKLSVYGLGYASGTCILAIASAFKKK